jgi:membrane protein
MARLLRLIERIETDPALGQAPRAAFYFFLSLFPLVLIVFSLTGLFGGDDAFRSIMTQVQGALPPATASYLAQYVDEVTGRERPGVLTLGVLLMLWSASAGMLALDDGLNAVYRIKKNRPWWKRRLIALALLAASVVLLIVGVTAVLAGPSIAEALGLGFAWRLLSVPIGFVPLVLLMWLIYYVLPNRNASHAKGAVLGGAAAGTLLWVTVSYIFRLYVVSFSSYDLTYGVVGAVIVLLLWLQFTALAVLLGAEVAAQIETRDRVREASG